MTRARTTIGQCDPGESVSWPGVARGGNRRPSGRTRPTPVSKAGIQSARSPQTFRDRRHNPLFLGPTAELGRWFDYLIVDQVVWPEGGLAPGWCGPCSACCPYWSASAPSCACLPSAMLAWTPRVLSFRRVPGFGREMLRRVMRHLPRVATIGEQALAIWLHFRSWE